jgi:hypothetical protein
VFAKAVKAGAQGAMSSYNEIDGVPTSRSVCERLAIFNLNCTRELTHLMLSNLQRPLALDGAASR